MVKRRAKKTANSTDAAPQLRRRLGKCAKDELINLLVELAGEDRGVLRRLAARIELESPLPELATATRQAIADATDFDERDANRNFSYDYEAYGEVRRNLTRLINLGELRLAMELSLELMKEASYQVEMSDEGLMTDDIQECLTPVIRALQRSDLPPGEVLAWCEAMKKSDRVGFICEEQLRALQKHLAAPTSQ